MQTMRTVILSGVATLLLAGGLLAQGHKPRHQVKIKEPQARATALARVPKATVQAEELEYEGGRWIYSYDLKVAGKPGIDEVNVDANTGRIVAVQHENPRDEAKEKAADAKAAARVKASHH